MSEKCPVGYHAINATFCVSDATPNIPPPDEFGPANWIIVGIVAIAIVVLAIALWSRK